MALQKAKIEILDSEAIDASRGLDARIDVQFNPTQYSLNKGAQIAEIGIYGIDSPILQFVRGQNEKLTLELFFDTTRPALEQGQSSMGTGAEDVRDKTKSIYQLVKMQPKTHAPPRVRFIWGSLSFKAIVESVQQKFDLFSPTGVPLRATLSVTFREYKTLEEQLAELNLQSSDHTKEHVVKAGETLSQIAAREYRDPGLWRHIASNEANRGKIDNPRRLRPGTLLLIPPIAARPLPSEG
jgi:hypothetical protein